uniref:Uncharacterized protein n=1 Tax=Anopheles maculatus TaxID=74869 RepID=A0A182SCG9_9DIPT
MLVQARMGWMALAVEAGDVRLGKQAIGMETANYVRGTQILVKREVQTRGTLEGASDSSKKATHRHNTEAPGAGGACGVYMWGEVLYGAGHQYDTALLPALVRQRPFGGLWPPEEPPTARTARKRPRGSTTSGPAHGRRPEAATLGVGVGVGTGSYGFCPTTPATAGLMQGVLPKTVSIGKIW